MAPSRSLPVAPGTGRRPARALSVAVVLPYGEPTEAFFPDTLLELCTSEARRRGHRAALVRVYYQGDGGAGDAGVRARLAAWLAAREADVIVVERVFDPEPIRQHVAALPGRQAVLLSWGDGDGLDGVDLVIGRTPGPTRAGTTRRSPSPGELVAALGQLLDALAAGDDPRGVPGVARLSGGALEPGPPGRWAPLPRPFAPALDHDVIAPGPPPPITRKYLFGNAGCPFADDPADNPHYRGLDLPADGALARLGCAFCHAGGDYQKRPDDETVAELLAQAAHYQRHLPDLDTLTLIDQHALRYLARLVREAHRAGLRPTRWLFAARADAFVREADRVREALEAARAAGHRLDLYLTGFESFSDRELGRYNKGVSADDLIASVTAMRQLARDWPDTFAHARAQGHSLILWSPWTSPDDLLDTVAAVRRHGLRELFHELGRNRLRLYPDLPVFHAASRDGALLDAWQPGDAGAGQRKGYSVERPWRFLDPRTRLAHGLAEALRRRLGPLTEPAQLAAAARLALAVPPAAEPPEAAPTDADLAATERAVLEGLDALDGELARLSRSPGRRQRAAEVALSGACNNGCEGCGQRERFHPDETLEARVDAARASGHAVLLAGREPTLHPAFVALVARARGADRRHVGVVSNGRRFALPAFARAAHAAGLRAASLKLFAPDAALADAIARAPGAFDQATAGALHLRRLGLALELRVPLHPTTLASLPSFADLAARLGIPRLLVEVTLDTIGLDRLTPARDALLALERRCLHLGVSLGASPLAQGAHGFHEVPRPMSG